MTTKNEKKEVRVLDLGEATALSISDFELLRLDPTQRPRQRAFIFANDEQETGNSIIETYRRHELNVDAYDFYLCMKELKNRIINDRAVTGVGLDDHA